MTSKTTTRTHSAPCRVGAHPAVDVADVPAGPVDEGGARVHDGLAARGAGHRVPVDGDAAATQRSRGQGVLSESEALTGRAPVEPILLDNVINYRIMLYLISCYITWPDTTQYYAGLWTFKTPSSM